MTAPRTADSYPERSTICTKCTGRACHDPFNCKSVPQQSSDADRIRERAAKLAERAVRQVRP